MMGVDKDARISLYAAPVWAAILTVSYLVLKSRNPQAAAFTKQKVGVSDTIGKD